MEKLCKNCGACRLACPEGAIGGGLVSDPSKCRGCGKCVDACVYGARKLCGEDMSVDRIIQLLLRDKAYYDESGGGVTISGGEPLYQAAGVIELIKGLKHYGLNVALDTSAFMDTERFKSILRLPDILLIDLKHMNNEQHKVITGVGNELIRENIRQTLAAGKRVIIRYPMIKGFNDDDVNIREMQLYLASIDIHSVDVIPYHDIGLGKYKALGLQFTPIEKYTDDEIAQKLKYIRSTRLQAKLI
jgi:pyruvate formate lyase activating enzyme